jgi:hypothetical protein
MYAAVWAMLGAVNAILVARGLTLAWWVNLGLVSVEVGIVKAGIVTADVLVAGLWLVTSATDRDRQPNSGQGVEMRDRAGGVVCRADRGWLAMLDWPCPIGHARADTNNFCVSHGVLRSREDRVRHVFLHGSLALRSPDQIG